MYVIVDMDSVGYGDVLLSLEIEEIESEKERLRWLFGLVIVCWFFTFLFYFFCCC